MTTWSAEIKDLEQLYLSFKGSLPALEKEIDRLIRTDDENMALVYARRSLEVIITRLCESELGRPRGTEPLKGIIEKLNKEEKVPHNIILSMLNLNSVSALGAHPKDFDPRQVKPVILDLTVVIGWYLKKTNIGVSDITGTDLPGSTGPESDDPESKKPVPDIAESKTVHSDVKVTDRSENDRGKSRKRILLAFVGISLIAIIAVVVILRLQHLEKVKWAREVALPEIERITEEMSYEGLNAWTAYLLVEEAREYIPGDPLLERLWNSLTWSARIYTDQPGASIYAKSYHGDEGDWRYFGETPNDNVILPIELSQIKIEKAGFRTVYDIIFRFNRAKPDSLFYVLPVEGSIPDEMVLLTPGSYGRISVMLGNRQLVSPERGEFLMDRFEVTNKSYKQFLDAGGYRDSSYWKYPVIDNGRELSWEETMFLFTDMTGKPGPATWEVGDYPEGQDDYPVTGVSWYEASAYAEFAGKSLPTVYHWAQAVFSWGSSYIIPSSNLNGNGPLPVGKSLSLNNAGTYDLAGNVREWCFNSVGDGSQRFIMGGGWSDPTYFIHVTYAQDPLDRTDINGFRCIKYLGSEEIRKELEKQNDNPFGSIEALPGVSDEVFTSFLSQFQYDKTELNAVIEEVTEGDYYTREKITFDAAYGGERMLAHLFLPKQGIPPYQTVVIFPGSGALWSRSSQNLGPHVSLLKSGRAVICPIYKSTYERGDDLKSGRPNETNFYKEHVIMWAKDLNRSIDYLETRKDIDCNKLAYHGSSWGGSTGPVMMVAEPRIKAAVLITAGLKFERALPEVYQQNYLPRVRTPVLMLNGKYDCLAPYETSQVPFYNMLGTPEEHKKLIVYEHSHSVPGIQATKETLAWLDKYLGPVNE